MFLQCVLVGFAIVSRTNGFVPQSLTRTSQTNSYNCEQTSLSSTTSDESSTKEIEKTLRQELTDRNSKVEDEEKYAVVDGTGMDTEQESEETDAPFFGTIDEEAMTDEAKMLERLIKKRPYGLFLAEKGVEILEDTVDGFLAKDKKDEAYFLNNDDDDDDNVTKEKVVVLGTGWGAAAFLKGIDTSRYDVTVISPRNYFVFTPMLAGASVGTVDYRSITEPIREVRIGGT